MNKTRIPVLSFFSGGGFLDMGFEQAGFSIVWTNEVNKVFAEMHSAGMTSWRKSKGNGIKAEIFNTKPIEEISPKNILKESFPYGKPSTFGIIGGPPCQDFSAAGRNAGFDGERGKLTKLFFDHIMEIKPQFFVVENVRNLVNNNKHGKRLEKLLKSMSDDYYIDKKVINALEFGIPQDRHRLFIIGLKKDKTQRGLHLESEFNFPWPVNKKYKNAVSKFNWPTITKFQNGTILPPDVPLELCVDSCMLKEFEEDLFPNGNEYFIPYSDKFWTIGEGDTTNRSFKRLHRFRFSPTACYGNNEVHLHPFLPRRISVREALRIQTVPDTYILPNGIGLTSKFKMIGNGVPVKLAYVVAEKLMEYLLKEN